MNLPIILNYGQGNDSTALFRRYIEEPESRDFELSDLILLTAQTGGEHHDTKRLVESHTFRLCRELGIRVVQVARAGYSDRDGVIVLFDSLHESGPIPALIEGAYTLEQFCLETATVPQYAQGRRRCSIKFKNRICNPWVNAEFGDRVVRMVFGFNSLERSRIDKADIYATPSRPVENPLLKWDWDRDRTESYCKEWAGESWPRSACTFCPFSITAGSLKERLHRFQLCPEEAVTGLLIEYVASSVNPTQVLYSSGSLHDYLERDGNYMALALFEDRLDTYDEWAVYEVRRIRFPEAMPWRSISINFRGSRQDCFSLLNLYANDYRSAVGGRGNRLPLGSGFVEDVEWERSYVVLPAVVVPKQRNEFEQQWADLFN